MPLEGMDPEVVESMGRDMQSLADQITSKIIPQIDRQVQRIPGDWSGKDANKFAQWWKTQHRTNLKKVAESLKGLGQSALNNAAEQRDASGLTSSASQSASGYSRESLGVVEPVGTPGWTFLKRGVLSLPVISEVTGLGKVVIDSGRTVVNAGQYGYDSLVHGPGSREAAAQYAQMVDTSKATYKNALDFGVGIFIPPGVETTGHIYDYMYGTDFDKWLSPSEWAGKVID